MCPAKSLRGERTAVTTRSRAAWAARAGLCCALALIAASLPVRAQTISTRDVGAAETEAGNIIADALRAAAGADIGLAPAAAFKPGASAPRPATAQQAAGLVEPADDAVVVLSLRGEQILAALERSVAFAPQKSSRFLQVSGLRFTYDPGKPAEKRLVETAANGAPIEKEKIYKVGTTRSLADGQLGYFQIWERSQVTGETGKTVAEALSDLAQARGGSLSAAPEGRINAGGK